MANTMRAELLRARINAQLEELERLEALPDDDFDVDAVLLWKRTFPGSREVYTYLAVKLEDGTWWCSNRRNGNSRISWEDLVGQLADRRTSEVWEAAEWVAPWPAS